MPFVEPNATNMVELFSYANTVTDNIFWQLILLAVFIVSYLALSSRSPSQKAFAGSGFLTGITGSFMFVLGFIQVFPLLLSLVVAIGSFVLLLFSKE